MAIAVKRFAIPSASGSVVVAHGLAETPKAIVFLTVLGDAAGTWQVNAMQTVGFWTPADGAKSVSIFGGDALATTSEGHRRQPDAIVPLGSFFGTGNYFTAAADGTNVTLSFPNTPGNAGAIIGMLIIAGPNVQAKIVRSTFRTTTGNQVVTGVGFTPDFVAFTHGGHADTTENASDVGARFGWGYWCNTGPRLGVSTVDADGLTTTATERRLHGSVVMQQINNAGVVLVAADKVSLDADGFTINYSTASPIAAPYYALCIKGVKAISLTANKKNGTGTQVITGAGFLPQASIVTGMNVASGTSVAGSLLGLGMCAGLGSGDKFAGTFQARDSLSTSDDNSYSNAKAFALAGADSNQHLLGEADMSSFDADGITLNWTTSDTTTALIVVLLLRVPDWGGVLADLATASDAIARATADARALADTGTASDAVARATADGRAIGDTAPGSDAVGRAVAFPRAVADTAGATDALTRAAADSRAIADTAGATDALSDTSTHPRAVSDTATASDALSRATSDARALGDTGPASDDVNGGAAFSRLETDSAPSSDSASSQGAYGRAPSDTAGATESLASAHGRAADLADSAPASDQAGRTVGSGRVEADSAPASDAAIMGATFVRRPSDSAPSSDVVARLEALARSVTDSAPSSDAIASQKAFLRLIAESISISDSLSPLAVHHITRLLTDSAPSSDALARILAFIRALSDSAPAIDRVRAVIPTPYVPDPTDAVVLPSATDVDLAASRTDARVDPSATDLELVGGTTTAVLTASRTDAEIFRGGGESSGFGDGGFGDGPFGG